MDSPHIDQVKPSSSRDLEGKRVAMVMFSHYPFDPRPRRAADALLKQGMSVDLVCLGEEKAPKRESLNGINVTRLPVTRRRGGKFAYAYEYSAFISMAWATLAFRSMRRRYDLVYVHNMPDVLVLSSLVPKVLGAKVILDQHDPMPELMKTIFNLDEKRFSVRALKKLEKWSIGFVDRVITVNIACQRIFSSRSCARGKISVVMNSPDESIFRFRSRGLQKVQADGPVSPFKMLYHGSIVERNGLDVAIDAFARLKKNVPAAELRICGPRTPFLDHIMAEVRSGGLEQSVHYQGSKTLEQLVVEIEACDVGIIPNHRNAFTDINTPTRLFEYLALGKPVIAPRTPGIQDYFNPESLFFFEPGDAEDLAQQLEYVAKHPQETDQIVQRGQQVYLAHTWSQERNTLLNVVRSLLCAGETL